MFGIGKVDFPSSGPKDGGATHAGRAYFRPRLTWLGYILAVAGTAGIFAVRLWLGNLSAEHQALTLFLFPVMLSAYVGGLGPGLASTGLGALGASYSILPPRHFISIAVLVHSDSWLRLVLTACVISILCEALHRQIAERATAEEKLRANEERLGAILGSAMDAIISVDEHQRITFFNPAAEKMFGSSAKEAIGSTLDRYIPERFRSAHSEHIRRFGQTHVTRRSMGQLGAVYGLRSNGEEFPLEASISQSDVFGQKLFTVILRDITERERAEASVRQQAALLDQAYDALFVWEPRGGITFWNRGAEGLYGYSAAEAVGRISHELLQTNRAGGVEEFYKALERDGKWEGELHHRTRDGRWIIGDSRMLLIRGPKGHLVFESVRDITEHKLAEAELEDLNKRLEQRVAERTGALEAANKELESFTYSVSHDLRAPLRHIDGFSKLLVEEHLAELSTDARDLLAMISESVLQMGMLIDDLLNLGRVGRSQLRLQVTGLGSLVDEVKADLARGNPDRVIEWKISTLPFVECDPGLMKQAFANLLSNAVKYTRPRKPAIIEVGVTDQNGTRAVFVRDNGVGFSMKHVDKLFGVFQRLHRSEDFEGTGVGLAIVQRIILKHGGRVWAQAELDKGATFYFTLGSPDDHHPEIQLGLGGNL